MGRVWDKPVIIKLKEKGVGGRKEIEGDKERERERECGSSNLLASLGVKAWFIRLCDESCPNGFHVVVSLPPPTDFAQRHIPLKDLVLRVTEGCVLGVEGAIVRLPSSLLPLPIYTVSCLASVLIAWLAARHAPQWRAHCQDPCRALRQGHSPLGLAAFHPAQQANTGLPAVCGQKSHRSGETEGQEPLQLERPAGCQVGPAPTARHAPIGFCSRASGICHRSQQPGCAAISFVVDRVISPSLSLFLSSSVRPPVSQSLFIYIYANSAAPQPLQLPPPAADHLTHFTHRGPWMQMLLDRGLPPFGSEAPLLSCSTAAIYSGVVKKFQRVAELAVVVTGIQLLRADQGNCMLADPMGTLEGRCVELHLAKNPLKGVLDKGTVLLLKDVTLYIPTCFEAFPLFCKDNIVKIYPPWTPLPPEAAPFVGRPMPGIYMPCADMEKYYQNQPPRSWPSFKKRKVRPAAEEEALAEPVLAPLPLLAAVAAAPPPPPLPLPPPLAIAAAPPVAAAAAMPVHAPHLPSATAALAAAMDPAPIAAGAVPALPRALPEDELDALIASGALDWDDVDPEPPTPMPDCIRLDRIIAAGYGEGHEEDVMLGGKRER